MYVSAVTEGVRVTVESNYSRTNSDPVRCYWFYTYRVRVHNEGTHAVRLLRRHWLIVDGEGREQQVEGIGVVGEQPYIEPGETYEYISGCPLRTPFGSMRGSYLMQRDDKTTFRAQIPHFFLREVDVVH